MGITYTDDEKRALVQEIIAEDGAVLKVARRRGVSRGALLKWIRDPELGGDPNWDGNALRKKRGWHPGHPPKPAEPAQLSLPTEPVHRPSNARPKANAPRATTPNFCPGCGYDLRRFRR